MAAAGGSASPRKPWEGARSASSGPSPFRPASDNSNTAAVVESAGVADSGDSKNAILNPTQNGAIAGRPPMPVRGYGAAGYNYNQQSNAYGMNPSYGGTGTYNNYNSYNSYNRGYGMGGGMYGGGYGLGNSYNGGMYGSNYGGGMYGGGYGMGMGGMGGMGMGMGMGTGMGMGMGAMGLGGQGPPPNGLGDPNNPFDDNRPPGGPSFWQSTLQKMHWMMVVFGNIVSLISENTQTFHVITTALYTFLDRSGMLAGFVLKLLRMWSRPRLPSKASNLALVGPKNAANLQIEGPKSTGVSWDNVWSSEPAS